MGTPTRTTPIERVRRPGRPRSAQQLVAASYALLGAYVAVGATRDLLGWWWANPAAALVIAGIAAREGVEARLGDACDCC